MPDYRGELIQRHFANLFRRPVARLRQLVKYPGVRYRVFFFPGRRLAIVAGLAQFFIALNPVTSPKKSSAIDSGIFVMMRNASSAD